MMQIKTQFRYIQHPNTGSSPVSTLNLNSSMLLKTIKPYVVLHITVDAAHGLFNL